MSAGQAMAPDLETENAIHTKASPRRRKHKLPIVLYYRLGRKKPAWPAQDPLITADKHNGSEDRDPDPALELLSNFGVSSSLPRRPAPLRPLHRM